MTTTTETAPAVASPKKKTIEEMLTGDEFRKQLAMALPKHMTPDRFVRVAMTARLRIPKLKECDPHSFFSCLMTLSQLGLEPDGRLAHLIPFNNRKKNIVECQLIVDYKGLVDLAMRSDRVANIHADKICENDSFLYNVGVVEEHKINFREPRGSAYAYYAQVTFKDGTKKADVMTLDEVEAIRKRSRAGNEGPWVTDFHEMGKKTVFRRLSKWIPMSAEFRDALAADADALEEKRFAAAVPAHASTIPNFEEETPVPENNAQEGGEKKSGNSEPSGAGGGGNEGEIIDPNTPQQQLSEVLMDLDWKEERFVAGLRLLDVQGIAKQAKTVADLSDAVCERIFEEGFDDIIASIEAAEARKK